MMTFMKSLWRSYVSILFIFPFIAQFSFVLLYVAMQVINLMK